MKKMISALAVAAVLAAAVPAYAAQGFQDVPVQSPYAKYVNDLQDKGIIVGYNGYFNPLDTLTRAEFATMAVKAFGLSISKNPVKFADSRGHWGAAFIQTGVDAGIIAGTSADTFDPDAKVKREEAAAIVWRVLAKKGVTSKTGTGGQDADSWAREAVQNVLAYDLHGVDVQNGAYRPLEDMVRQESAALFSTALVLRPALSVIVINPTTNANNMVDNADGTKSFGNVSMPASNTAGQTEAEARSCMELLGKIKFQISGEQVMFTVPATGSSELRWDVADEAKSLYEGSDEKTITVNGSVGVILYDYNTGRGYGQAALILKNGTWVVKYPTK